MKFKRYLQSLFQLNPKKGYALWAPNYDNQNNLMHLLDKQLVTHLLEQVSLKEKCILDFGCGTGRYWSILTAAAPSKLVGCDLSPPMLLELKKKYPQSNTFHIQNEKMPFLTTRSIDFLISTLAIGHFKKLHPYFEEWNRVLKPNAFVLITGNHPVALKQGVKRTFSADGKTYNIQNIIHDFEEITHYANTFGWKKMVLKEQVINEDHFSYFQKFHAEKSYKNMYGKPVVYGLLMQKMEA